MMRLSRHRRWRGAALSIPALMLVTALADCAGHGRPHDDARANVYPENYKADLLGFLHSYINDANKIRDAAISEPALRPVPAAPASGGGPMAISGGIGGRTWRRRRSARGRWWPRRGRKRRAVRPERQTAGTIYRLRALQRQGLRRPLRRGQAGDGRLRAWPLRPVCAANARAVRRGRISAVSGIGSFRALGAPIRLTNDIIALSNYLATGHRRDGSTQQAGGSPHFTG